MKLGKIIKNVGTSLLKNIIPGAGIVLDTINAVLPDDKKLDIDTATGEDMTKAINSLSPEQQASILSKEFDVEIEEIRGFTERFQATVEADKTGNTTRPTIALMMAGIVCIADIVAIAFWAVAVWNKWVSVENSWPLMLTILGTPTALLRAYFGMRTKEKESRYQMAFDQPISSGGLIGGIIKAFRK